MSVLTWSAGGVTVPRPSADGHPGVTHLVTAGLLPRRPPADGLVIDDLSRAHDVWRVTPREAPGFIVKSLPGVGSAVGVEFCIYRMANWCEPLRAALPEAVLVDEDRGLLILADCGARSLAAMAGHAPQLGVPTEASFTPHDREWLAVTVERLGRVLGRLHRGTAALPLPAAPPPLALAGPTGTGFTGPLSDALSQVASDTLFASAARRLSGVRTCLVSHDMKWDNIAVGPADEILLLDWELGGMGDPAVDLGFLLAEHLLRATGAGLTQEAGALLAGYASGAMVKREAAPVLARRSVLAAGLRIMQLGLEVVETRPHLTEPLFALAREVLTDPVPRAQEVETCLAG